MMPATPAGDSIENHLAEGGRFASTAHAWFKVENLTVIKDVWVLRLEWVSDSKMQSSKKSELDYILNPLVGLQEARPQGAAGSGQQRPSPAPATLVPAAKQVGTAGARSFLDGGMLVESCEKRCSQAEKYAQQKEEELDFKEKSDPLDVEALPCRRRSRRSRRPLQSP